MHANARVCLQTSMLQSPTEAVIFPALCYLRIVKKNATLMQVILSIGTIVVGIISAVMGTYSSIANIAKSY
ncbi:hypothetical protein RJ641_027553 [Dillenia turbinata]|uniref:Amino acid transporter transmembrane domain-containing protein n=1 Tax=Dillenia turbinata TaxID=194707 RepID=A0AAN8W6B9_9MAGN